MCNPYDTQAELSLKCELQIPEEDLARANIRWFNGTEQLLTGISDPVTSVSLTTISSTITLSYTSLFENDINEFKCLLDLNGESWRPSDSLLLGSNDLYMNYFMCVSQDIQSKEDNKCAVDLSATRTTSSSTSSDLPTMEPATSVPSTFADSPTTTTPLSLHTPTPTPSPSPFESDTTLTIDQSSTVSVDGGSDSGGASPSGMLEVWIYVLVAVAAVFAMIIIILAIMCVGLCLRRSKTIDTNSLKRELTDVRVFVLSACLRNVLYM